MRKHITWLTALGLTLAAATTAFAQAKPAPTPPAPGTAAPGQRLQLGPRIRDGVRSGQLTRPEMQRLRQRMGEIREHARLMRRDGARLAPNERREIRREWRQASRMLFQMKHNRFRRGGR